MKTITHDAWLTLREGAAVIERDGHGKKVLQRSDGTYLKLFRRKRLLSSAMWSPYAQRFADNAAALQTRQIPCPRVIEVLRIPSIERDAVHYHPLPGQTLREIVSRPLEGPDRLYLRYALNRFIRRLHDQGIYFRSLHLGNVVLVPNGELGLIDISDLRIHRGPLSLFWRKRNLERMQNIDNERDWIDRKAILAPLSQPAAGATR